MLRRSGQERRGTAAHPIVMAGAIIGGQRVVALATRHMQITDFLVPRHDGESFGSAESRTLRARHVIVAGEWNCRHVEETGENMR